MDNNKDTDKHDKVSENGDEKELRADVPGEVMAEKPTYWEPKSGEGGMTELLAAAYSGDLAEVLAVIRAGVDLNAQDQSGWTALHWAADMGMVNGEREAVMAVLIQAGADLNVRDNEGSTPLLTACRSGNEDIVRQLVAAGADFHASNNRGWTPLIEAVGYGNPQTVIFLIESGANKAARTVDGRTALDVARDYQWDEIVQILSKLQ